LVEDTLAPSVMVHETRDLDEAHAHVNSVYKQPLHLVSHGGEAVKFDMSHISSKCMTVGRLHYGADVEVVVEPLSTWYQFDLTIADRVQIRQRSSQVLTDGGVVGAVLNPTHPFSVRYSPDAVQYAIMVSRTSMDCHLAALLGRPVDGPIPFDLGIDLACAQGQSLLAAVRHLHVELTRLDGVAGANLIRAQLESHVLTQMLLATRHPFRESLLGVAKPAGRAYVNDAVEFIEQQARLPITVQDIAQHAHVCVRALQLGFRDELGVSPTTYLRKVRLHGAYEDIVNQHGELSITEVAYRWGFRHLGRFAQLYREQFGFAPSDTPR
jgi:AraC-like DNA-binding protein